MTRAQHTQPHSIGGIQLINVKRHSFVNAQAQQDTRPCENISNTRYVCVCYCYPQSYLTYNVPPRTNSKTHIQKAGKRIIREKNCLFSTKTSFYHIIFPIALPLNSVLFSPLLLLFRRLLHPFFDPFKIAAATCSFMIVRDNSCCFEKGTNDIIETNISRRTSI